MHDQNVQRIVVFRHGETDWNHQGLVQGTSDLPLNSNGIQQAENLAKNLQKYGISHIFSSDKKRAIQTAEIVANVSICGISVHEALREQNFGIAEGQDRQKIRNQYAELFTIIDDISHPETNTKFLPSAESRLQVFNRVAEPICAWASQYQGQTIGISTHGGVILSLLSVQFKKIISVGTGEYITLLFDIKNMAFSGLEI